MIKHIVLFDIAPQVPPAQRELVREIIAQSLLPLVGQVEGLLSLEVGQNVVAGGKDICLSVAFDSLEALERYQPHPLHQKALGEFGHLLTNRVACDYEVNTEL